MSDIIRTRDRAEATVGMGLPSEDVSPEVAGLIKQMQENIQTLFGRIQETAVPEDVEVDPSIRADIDANKRSLVSISNSLERLSEETKRPPFIRVYLANTGPELFESFSVRSQDFGYALDDTLDVPREIWWQRNEDNDGWEPLGGGVGFSPPENPPPNIKGTTASAGETGRSADEEHQHGYPTSTTTNDTVFFSGGIMSARLAGVNRTISHLE